MMWWNGGMGLGGWIVMTLFMVAFWALVIVGIVAIFRGVRDDRPSGAAVQRDPMQILDERFARGEIDAEEYRARQDVLRAAH
jgi:putative membrane protein